ncbi:ABC transporter ATP-binding protein/permease [bacterium]|nr:ABC transporter ATP-binding protein/permease [bacterium]
MKTLLRLLKYILPFKKHLLGASGCMLIYSTCTVAMPWMMKQLIDTLPGKEPDKINLILLSTFGIALILGLARYGQAMLLSFIGQRVIFNLRSRIFDHLLGLSISFHKEKKKGEIISRITNDVLILQNFFSEEILSIIKNPFIVIGSISVLLYIHWKLTLLTLVLAPLAVFAIIRFGRRMRGIALSTQQRMAGLLGMTTEILHNIMTVKVFTKENYEKERFAFKNQDYFKFSFKGIKLISLSGPLVEFLGTMGIVIVCGYGAHQVIEGSLTTGKLVAFLFYIGVISSPLKSLTNANLLIQQAISAGNHIFEILDVEEEERVNNPIKIKKGEIQIENLSFSYRKKPVLSNINLKIENGERVAIVGPSGAGKSTLINLILGFYHPDVGRILIDGQDIKGCSLLSLRQSIGVVPQEVALFSGTVSENIAYGAPNYSTKEIEKAAVSSCADEFIAELSDGYQTEVGEHGARLSGGQRQRIAIARAIIINPKILILDEATSHVDQESEKLLRESITVVMRNQTTIIVAHRLSSILSCDRIVVMNRGEIAEIGTHLELIKKNGVYKRLYESG